MVQAVTIVFNHYLSVAFEDFTAKAISGLGVLRTLDSDDDLENDIIKIKRIIDITSDDLFLSMYVLDRWVNPDSTIDKTLILNISDEAPDILKYKYRNGRTFSKDVGSDYFLQKKLCEAIAEIHLIVMKHIASYNVNFVIGGDLSVM